MKRIALVVGNASYQFAKPLAKTHADASAIANTLAALGFQSPASNGGVAPLAPFFDLSLSDMSRLFADFNRSARTADLAIVYFSGHGIEIGLNNYLIPVEAELNDVIDVEFKAFPLQRAITAVAGAARLRLVVLDACRDNPFAHAITGLDQTKSLSAGLAAPKDTRGAIIFFAAEEGHKAREGKEGALSPFANALVKYLPQPDRSVLGLFGKVTSDVRDATDNYQKPRFYGEPHADDVFLNPIKLVDPDPTASKQVKRVAREPAVEPKPNDGTTVRNGQEGHEKGTGIIIDPPSRFDWRVLALGGAALVAAAIIAVIVFWPIDVPPKPPQQSWSGYGVYIHTSRPDADVGRLKLALSQVGFDVLGVDKEVDQPSGLSPQTAIDYSTRNDAGTNAAAAAAAAAIVKQTLDVDINPRQQSQTPNRKLGVWLPSKPDYKVSVRFAGSFNRDTDIVPMMQKLRSAGWNASEPLVSGSSDRTADAGGLREIRFSRPEDRAWAELLADDVLKTGIVTPPVNVVPVLGIVAGALQVWISPAGPPLAAPIIARAEQWAKGVPDAGFCFQRKDSSATPGKFLVRCFRTSDLCQLQRSRDSGTLTPCVYSVDLTKVLLWKGAGPGGILNSWFKYSDEPLSSPPFPNFP